MTDDALEVRFAGIRQHHRMREGEHLVQRCEHALERVVPGVHAQQRFERCQQVLRMHMRQHERVALAARREERFAQLLGAVQRGGAVHSRPIDRMRLRKS